MRLTHKKLKQLILETMNEALLTEEAKGIKDLPDYAYVHVFARGRHEDLITVMFTDKDGNMLPPVDIRTGEDKPIWGDVSFFKQDPNGRPCDGAAVIAITNVADGWGPFLYDIAMEIATMHFNGLTSDRNVVSYPDAQDVWYFYNQYRAKPISGDVKAYQLDDEYNSLTPKKSDNCGQSQARERSQDYGGVWSDKDNPLSKRYTKPPVILNQLKDKLIWDL